MDADDLPLLKAGIAAAQAGRVPEARQFLARALSCREDRALTWIWQASVAPSRMAALASIERALLLEPENPKALDWHKRLALPMPAAPQPTAPVPAAPVPAAPVPAAPVPAAPVPAAPQAQPQPPRPTAILVIDDSPTVRAVLIKALSSGGYAAQGASGGREGLSRLERESFDAVLLDISMPDMDGFTVCRTIRQRTFGRRLPVLMVSGDSRPGDIEKCKAAGANACLKKPIGAPLLLEVLERQLRATRAPAVASNAHHPGQNNQSALAARVVSR